MNYYAKFSIFAEEDFDSYSGGRIEELKQAVQGEASQYILNVNEAEYIEHIAARFTIEPVALHFDHVEASMREELIPAEHFPSGFHVYRGKSYSKPVVTYHLPVSGNLDLLRCVPNPRVLMTYKVWLQDQAVCFDFIDFYGNAEQIKGQADGVLRTLKDQSGHLAANVARFNGNLRRDAEALFRARKDELLKQTNTLAALGVPIRKAAAIPTTFAVPAQRKQVMAKPLAAAVPPKTPDPALDEGIYQDILQTIHDTGKVFERLPGTYADKDEEALRDHLILQLEPRFEYSTTGETFNKSGKTDILVRHEKANVFVAECKFWRGGKKHFETIDQILSYLTWRDSKTAIIYFMDTKEMAAPLKAIEESTPQHPCFVKFNGLKHGSWFDYTLHLPGDTGVEIRCTILCFHLPTL